MKKLFLIILMLAVPMMASASEKEDFVIENGALLEYNGSDSYVEIPGTVKVINEIAFRGNKKLLSVKIPGSVEEIQGYAFKNCTSLRTVNGMAQTVGESAPFPMLCDALVIGKVAT